jgi:hypothetical protein
MRGMHTAQHPTTMIKTSGQWTSGKGVPGAPGLSMNQMQQQKEMRPSPFAQQSQAMSAAIAANNSMGSGFGGPSQLFTSPTGPNTQFSNTMGVFGRSGTYDTTNVPGLGTATTSYTVIPGPNEGLLNASRYPNLNQAQAETSTPLNPFAIPFQQTAGEANPTNSWNSFFDPISWKPLLSFNMLATEIFNHLDTQGAQNLTPEQYSGFLHASGFPDSENTWRKAFNAASPYSGVSREAWADSALRRAYMSFEIPHEIGKRKNTMISFGNPMGGASPVVSQVPLITLHGFIKLLSFEVLFDPSKGQADLNRAMENLALPLFKRLGPIPRWVLPDKAPPGLLQKAQDVLRKQQQEGGLMGVFSNQGTDFGAAGQH